MASDILAVPSPYAYDTVGNRSVQTWTITNMQVTTYTRDNNGNLTNDVSALYRYDQANRLINTTLSGATTLFNYNGDGTRSKR